MVKTTLFRALLIPTAFLTLTACGGGEDSESTAAGSTTPSAGASSAPPAAAAGRNDKELCGAFKDNQEKFQEAWTEAFTSSLSDPSEEPDLTVVMKKLLSQMSTDIAEIAATGSADSEVTAALRAYSAEAGKVASAADPEAEAVDNPAFETAGEAAIAACQKAGFDVGF